MLKQPDVVLLAEIYAARETNDIGISSKDLAARIPGARYCATLPEVTAALRELARPGGGHRFRKRWPPLCIDFVSEAIDAADLRRP